MVINFKLFFFYGCILFFFQRFVNSIFDEKFILYQLYDNFLMVSCSIWDNPMEKRIDWKLDS